MAQVNTGTGGVMELTVTLVGGSNPGNYSTIRVIASIYSPSGTFGSPMGGWSVSGLASGEWSTTSAAGWETIYDSGNFNIYHNPDGTHPGVGYTFHIDWTGTSGVGGPTDVYQGLSLPTRKVVPATPTGLTATRISDTQVNLSWSHSGSASNGQPTQNKIQKRVNGGAWQDVATIAATTTASVTVAANQQLEFRVLASNTAGSSAYSAVSNTVYTTPAAPSGVTATKNGSNIDITFVENVGYDAYNHEVWHGTITGGVTTWDGSPLATLAAGDLDYTHTAPNPAQVHVYRVRAKQGTLYSGYSVSNSVQLLTAPAKPTVPALPAFANRSAVFRLPWTHNPIDSSGQTKYQWRWSSNGGSSWTTGSKTTSTNQYHDFASGTWSANQTIRFQVRTKGQYDSGSDGDASYSPWSDPVDVTFKSLPVATIISPANASVYPDAVFKATLGFAQAEGATYVKSELELIQSAVVLEARESTLLVGITFDTPVANGGSYSVRARVQDSNGLWSAWVTHTFTVTYTLPVPAVVTTTYLPETGWGQLDLTIAAPGGGQAAASTVTITRTIDGVEETVVENYPVASAMTFLDTFPTIHGTNSYKVTTISAIGARNTVLASLITSETKRAFLSKGAGFATVVCFGGNLTVSEALSVASDTVPAAGRTKPIGLYGVEQDVQLKVSSTLFEGFGSTIKQVRDALLIPGKTGYRGPDGRRVVGPVKGGINRKSGGALNSAQLSFTIAETS